MGAFTHARPHVFGRTGSTTVQRRYSSDHVSTPAQPEVSDVTAEIYGDDVERGALNGHPLARRDGQKQIPPVESLALAGAADLGRLLADSDKQTLAILE